MKLASFAPDCGDPKSGQIGLQTYRDAHVTPPSDVLQREPLPVMTVPC
jgi:hypothetical protein